ncbi:hypothetical protein DPMN_051410 [Dreissena polymorpha]|uniref:Uncharacterized protein n=1 Tax=Dreissena polymorpha TaxID=45954 RepID=A0A9D4CHT2_DREPO|nr:hypothetical protein DPMN_051410 [Dreissena polymorpha]
MITVISEKGAVVPSTLNDGYIIDCNDVINWVLLTLFIKEMISQKTYRKFQRNRNRQALLVPYPEGANENTALKEVTPAQNSQSHADPMASSAPISSENTGTQWQADVNENAAPQEVTPTQNVQTPVAPAIRTDLQLLQKEKDKQ